VPGIYVILEDVRKLFGLGETEFPPEENEAFSPVAASVA
jgi:hypothetical protein